MFMVTAGESGRLNDVKHSPLKTIKNDDDVQGSEAMKFISVTLKTAKEQLYY